MKPVYLEFCGINSFSEKAQIDFRALLSGGVFGIFGDTGSGKSTILDCIHLALYNKVERAAQANDCLNYNVDKAYVIFDFEITTEGKRHAYRVQRERRRSGQVKAFLYEYEGEKLLALAEGTRDVDAAIVKIIGLEFNDFKMCIALPQGDFAALVKAATAERVKLVSRLFDLEYYGEKLRLAVNERYYKAEADVNLLKAEMGQNEGGRDASIEEKQKEIAEKKQAMALVKEEESQAEIAYEKAAALAKEKAQFDQICKTLGELESKLPVMMEKRALLERLPLAKVVLEKAKAVAENERDSAAAFSAAERAKVNAERANAELLLARHAQEEGQFDERILKLSVDLEKVRGAQADILEAEKAEERLQSCRKEYAEVAKRYVEEDFIGQRTALEEKLSALGQDDTLLAYLKHHFKDILQADTYAEICLDLQNLSEKYPQTQVDVAALVEKYTPNKSGAETFDFEGAQFAFKEIEKQRKALKKELENLEARKREFDNNKAVMELLKKQGAEYRAACDAAKEKIAFIQYLGTANELEKRLKDAQEERAKAQKNIEMAQEKSQSFFAETEKQKGLYELHKKLQTDLENSLKTALTENGFESVDEAKLLVVQLGDEGQVKEECKRFFEQYELFKSKRAEIDEQKFYAYDENGLAQAQLARAAVREKKDGLTREIAAAETELVRLLELREKYRAFEKELAVKEKEKNLCDELRTLIKQNKLLEFVASEYLQEICITASKRLLALTGGRYFLRYEKEFKVGDNLDGGNLRAVKTLSGGETFLVSLSLALSLSGAICQKSLRPIEFFFLDEGFGTLDKNLVDTVMDVLGKLSKDFAIGLISHVEELKHRIDNKILVSGATEEHGSQVRLISY